MIKNSSASALTWLSAILLFVGLLMMSPSGSFGVYILAALVALTPAIFGIKKIRIVAVILLLTAILLAANKYPEFQNERERISKRTKISHRDFPTNIYISSQKNTDLRQEGKCPI